MIAHTARHTPIASLIRTREMSATLTKIILHRVVFFYARRDKT